MKKKEISFNEKCLFIKKTLDNFSTSKYQDNLFKIFKTYFNDDINYLSLKMDLI